MSERKLAHVEVIESLTPIEGADKIETAHVLGWECVVKKGEFSNGQMIGYIEVDSIVPERPEFEFLRDRKCRVRTIKLRGQVSQGLVIPLTSIGTQKKYVVGDDITSELGITKYLTPSERDEEYQQQQEIKMTKSQIVKFMLRYEWFRKLYLKRKTKEGFPNWVGGKTDEERIQNMPQVLHQFADEIVYVTEKVDYQSVTFTSKIKKRFTGFLSKLFPHEIVPVVCSRNMTTNDKNSLYWRIFNQYNIGSTLRYNPTITIQGEQGSGSVQGNKYKLKNPRLFVFNVFDHKMNYLFNFDEMTEFCGKWGLETVPFLGYYKLSDIGTTVEELVEFSKGKSKLADIEREGVVIRSIVDGKKVLSFKVINPNFLLKHEN